ncbi:endo alpha-1,4 polygalactosaminidase [Spongiactinospora sp. 9N601]|uniref:endo alpha-1,4 polygalactosaminidase n=1 Tax=Spongiactinospora sp. 9N601 TaxID=3375149 RepID=UPI0037ABD4B5
MVSPRKFFTRVAMVVALAAAMGPVATSTATAGTDPAPAKGPAAENAIWRPPLNSRWQYQLQGTSDFPATGGVNVDVCTVVQPGGECVRPTVFDIDLYAAQEVTGNNHTLNTAAVKAIHANGAKAICYIDAGSIETYRPDYQQFLDWHNANGKSLLGKPFDENFPDENWANINNDRGQRDFLLKMMAARVDKCVQAGFDGVEYDVVHAHEEDECTTGWKISYDTQLIYNRALAKIAHDRGLSVALKYDLGQIKDLLPDFDYAVNESCHFENECAELLPFVKAGKPVFHVEYKSDPAEYCSDPIVRQFNSIKKPEDLSLYDDFQPCS